MPKVIKFGAVSPRHLNLNGDVGNLLVLKKRLAWRGVESSTVEIQGSEDLSNFDFILLGHGSSAAWAQLLTSQPNLLFNLVSFIKNGGSVLAVASAADLLHPLLSGLPVNRGKWESKFVQEDSVVGYVNTTSEGKYLVWIENALLTQMHGPVLAKNPELADVIISKNGWADTSIVNSDIEEVDNLAAQSRKIAFEH